MDLPVESVLPELAEALRSCTAAVLCAAPGAGKTTLVPPFLLKEFGEKSGKILMLEPRRLAVRASARRIAALTGTPLGGLVGYRTRFDSRVSPETRIEVLTEGILTRLIQSDPELTQVHTVIFDEFHERSVHADLALALCLDLKQALRGDLRILIMSATLDAERVSALLDGAPVIRSPGRVYPVRTVYLPRRDVRAPIEPDVARAVLFAQEQEKEGDLLVFLPGEREIRRTAGLLKDSLPPEIRVTPLYGNLSREEQDAAIDPDPEHRKVILSTSIAETSLTIEGVRTVIDSGKMRVPKFSPRNGMGRLETVPVSLASADQRRGRAGRTAPGACYRLWSQEEERRFQPFNTPEILDTDLLPLLLELACWGVRPEAVSTLRWLDPPPEAGIRQAARLLRELGALDRTGAITKAGAAMRNLPVHPRLARSVLRSAEEGFGYTACCLAALLEERDPLRNADSTDLRHRLSALNGEFSGDAGTIRRIRDAVRQIAAAASVKEREIRMDKAGVAVAFAYPDRIARARSPKSGEYALSNGTGAKLRETDPLCRHDFLALASVEGESDRQTIFSAAPLSFADIETYLPEQLSEDLVVRWNPERKAVEAEKRIRIGAMTAESHPVRNGLPPERIRAALLEGIREEGIGALPFDRSILSLRERVEFLRRHQPGEWPDFSDAGLLASLEEWLAPFAEGITGIGQLKNVDLRTALESRLTPKQRMDLPRLAPERIEIPSGSRVRVDYSQPDGVPVIAAKLQELFGMLDTPRLLNGRVPVTIQMLSPAMRPVQTTSDLRHFWTSSYFLVRKDLRGRYPKHDWPENPLEARAHRGVRKPDRN